MLAPLLTDHLFLAAFQDLLHLVVLVHQVFPSSPHYFWQLLRVFVLICLHHHPSSSCHSALIFHGFLGNFALVCLHHHLSSSCHSPFIFGGFLGYFALVFFFLLAVAITSCLSLPAFEVILHLFVTTTIFLGYNFNKYLWAHLYLLLVLATLD